MRTPDPGKLSNSSRTGEEGNRDVGKEAASRRIKLTLLDLTGTAYSFSHCAQQIFVGSLHALGETIAHVSADTYKALAFGGVGWCGAGRRGSWEEGEAGYYEGSLERTGCCVGVVGR